MTRNAAQSLARVIAAIAFAVAAVTALAAFASYLSSTPGSSSDHLHVNAALMVAILALCASLLRHLPRRLIQGIALFVLATAFITIVAWVFDVSSLLEHLFFDPLPWMLDRFPTRATAVAAIVLGNAAIGATLIASRPSAGINALTWAAGVLLLWAAIYRIAGALINPGVIGAIGVASRSDLLFYLAAAAYGFGLLAHANPFVTAESTLWLRLRMLFLLWLASSSVILWQGLRFAEWRNLQAELEHVMARDITAANRNYLERSNSFLRLMAGWRELNWQPTDEAMRDDARSLLFGSEANVAAILFDEHGQLIKAVARSSDGLPNPAEPVRAEIITQDQLERRFAWNPQFTATVSETIASQQMLSAAPQGHTRPLTSLVTVHITGPGGKSKGACAFVLNLDALIGNMFAHVTPGYTMQLTLQDSVYQVGEGAPRPRMLPRIAPVTAAATLARLPWTIESWPDGKTLNQLLTPLPGIVLAGGWLASILLLIAWRAEHRAQRVLADRQAILDNSLLNEQRMAEAQRIAHVGSWNYSPELDQFECSDECLRILGIDNPSQLHTYADRRKVVYPGDMPAISAAAASLANGGTTVDFIHRAVKPNGEIIYLHSRASSVAADAESSARSFGTLQDITEYRALEEALRSSEARYRSIAAQVGAIHLEWDLASGQVHFDGALEEVLGYQPADLKDRSFHDMSLLVHPDDTMQMRATLKLARESVSDWHAEYRIRHKDGHYVYVNSRGVFLIGTSGKAERMVMAAADISERKNVELRLRDSEERLRIATEQSGRVVYDLNVSTNRVRWAGATQLLFGFSIAEMEKMTWDECLAFLHPRDLKALQEITARGEDRNINQREFRMRRSDGAYIYVESISAAQLDEQGRSYRRIGVLSNITARRNAENERQQYTTQLRTLAEVARNITIFLTVDELVEFLAGAMRDIIGTHQAAISIAPAHRSGKTIHRISLAQKYGDHPDVVPLSDDNLILELLGEHGTTARLARDQLQAHLCIAKIEHYATGEVPLEGLLAARMLARDGSPIGLLRLSAKKRGEFTDSDVQILTQLAGLAAVAVENARLLETLEERVTQRTQDLEVSNRELEAFSYSVSHDLRAPLRAIAGFSQILNDRYAAQLDEQGLRCLQRISAGVQKMAELIDDLLGLARVSRAEITRQQLNLSALAATLVNRHCERAPDRRLEIRIDPDMIVPADPRLLEVVLDNLIENAFKFTGKREDASIHIGSEEAGSERQYFIADNGVGFDPAYASNLFGVFQRLHSVNDFPGTGVGLAIVQRILHRHGGRIWAQSKLDVGATFYFTLGPAVIR